MHKHDEIYHSEAERYDALVMREDYQHHIVPAINLICPLAEKEIVESGAGTGRLTLMLSPLVRNIKAFDASAHMLNIAQGKASRQGLTNIEFGVADHRLLPVEDLSADLVISGWSVCYLLDQEPQNWNFEVDRAILEMQRILRPGGVLLLIETLGTGFEAPHPPDHLIPYLDTLEKSGFHHSWIRTDYEFTSLNEAVELTDFFFGREVSSRFTAGSPLLLPECTGLWWKQKPL